MKKRLFRSKTEKMIAGVCGGLAMYFDIDPVIIRIIAVALVFAGGSGGFIYLILWVIMPNENEVPPLTPTPPSASPPSGPTPPTITPTPPADK